jgi:hypothetical protein
VQDGLVNLCFFEGNNCKRYVQLIIGQFFPELTHEERLYGWFQQDSAAAHTTCLSMQALSHVFGDRIISSGTWPACSSDLNPCDFFIRGSLKDKVYKEEEELQENIRRKYVNISAEELQRVIKNLFCQCEECLHVEGQHFQHVM